MTLYLCSICNGVHDSTEPTCTSWLRPVGIGTYNPSLASLVTEHGRLASEVESLREENDRLRKDRDEARERAERILDVCRIAFIKLRHADDWQCSDKEDR